MIELANILDAADIERFIKRNPGFIGLRPDYLQNQGGVREMKRFVLEGRPELKALLNDIRKVTPNYSEYEERELTLFLRPAGARVMAGRREWGRKCPKSPLYSGSALV